MQAASAAFDADRTSMFRNDSMAHPKSETSAFLPFRREERMEQIQLRVGAHAWPVVDD